jgi:hypothetical protein
MALKDIDLKTVESYKKAMKSEAVKISPGEAKTKFWIYKDLELPTEGGKRQKVAPFLALTDDKSIKPLLKGKTLLCRGLCALQDGKVLFEAEQGKVPYKSLKASLPGLLGKQLAIPPGVNSDEDGDGVAVADGETPAQTAPQVVANGATAAPVKETPVPVETPSPAGTSLADQVTAAWKKLQPEIQQKSAINPAVKSGAMKAQQQIEEQLKAGKAEAAKQILEGFTRALNAVTTAPVTGQAAPGITAADLSAEWQKLTGRVKALNNPALNEAAGEAGKRIQELVRAGKLNDAKTTLDQFAHAVDNAKPAESVSTSRLTPADITGAWQKLIPDLKQKATSHPELNEAGMKARKELEELTKAGKLDAAKKVIEELAVLIAKAAEPEPGKQATAQTPEKAESEAPENRQKTEYERTLKGLEGDIESALKEQRGDTSQIRNAVALASERAEDGDFTSAMMVLSSLAVLLRESESAEDDQPAPGLVEYRKKLLAFDSARQKAFGQIDKLAAAIPQTFPEERDLAEELASELQEDMEEIDDLVDAALNAAKNEKSPVTAALKTQIQGTLKELAANKLIQHVEKNPFGVAVEIQKMLSEALEAILDAMPVEV